MGQQDSDVLYKTFLGVEVYQRGPIGAHLIQRITYNAVTHELLATDDIKVLMSPQVLDRLLPEGVHNIRTEFHYILL